MIKISNVPDKLKNKLIENGHDINALYSFMQKSPSSSTLKQFIEKNIDINKILSNIPAKYHWEESFPILKQKGIFFKHAEKTVVTELFNKSSEDCYTWPFTSLLLSKEVIYSKIANQVLKEFINRLCNNQLLKWPRNSYAQIILRKVSTTPKLLQKTGMDKRNITYYLND